MKTEFLKGLGITEQSVIDSIMAENGRDVNAVKGNTEQLTTQVADLQKQITDRDTQLSDLKKTVKDNTELTARITELETANTTATADYTAKIATLQKNYAVENAVRDSKAKSVKAVMAYLDMDKITLKDGKLDGISDQLDALTKGEETNFLFGEVKTSPAGTHPNDPPAGGQGTTPPTSKTLAEAVAKALSANK